MHARATITEIDQAVGVIVLMIIVVVRMTMILLVLVIVVGVWIGRTVIVRGCSVYAAGSFELASSAMTEVAAATDGAHHSTSISATRNSSPAVIRT